MDGQWRFNVPVLWEQYDNIVGWQTVPPWPHPALFIPGGNSPYVTDAYRETLLAQFPQARAHVIAGRRALGACRKTGGRYPRDPSLFDLYRRVTA